MCEIQVIQDMIYILAVIFYVLQVAKPFELIGKDLIGKLKTTKAGNQYICVMIDYLWPQAYAIKSKTAEEVSQCILKFFYQFEAPKVYLPNTDQQKCMQDTGNPQKPLLSLASPDKWTGGEDERDHPEVCLL